MEFGKTLLPGSHCPAVQIVASRRQKKRERSLWFGCLPSTRVQPQRRYPAAEFTEVEASPREMVARLFAAIFQARPTAVLYFEMLFDRRLM